MNPSPFVLKITNSGYLNGDEKKLLQHLAKCSYPENLSNKRKVATIAVELDWDEDRVTSCHKKLLEAIHSYYSGPGMGERFLLQVAAGGRAKVGAGENYFVRIIDRELGPNSARFRFWKCHFLNDENSIVIASNAPLFLRHPEGKHRLRILHVNDKATRRAYEERGDQPSINGYKESFHYVSLGDFRFCVAACRFFAEMGQKIEVRIVMRDLNLIDLENRTDQIEYGVTKSLIAIGNPRVSFLVDHLQEQIEPNFYIPEDDSQKILNRYPIGVEAKEFLDVPSPGGRYYAVLIRRILDSRAETLILVQNGPALERISAALLGEVEMATLLTDVGWGGKELPNYFECLFEVTVAKNELANRTIPPKLVAMRTRHWKTSDAANLEPSYE